MITTIKNAKIYTCNMNLPWATTMAYQDDSIIYIGNDEYAPIGDCVIDLMGKTILPGFIDSHTHPGMVCQSSWHIKLPWFENVDDLLDYVREYAKQHTKEEIPFLYFEYYPTTMFDQNGPNKEMLDSAVSDRPCLCQDFGEHLHWVNTAMLEAMGITKETPDPAPGLEMFVRDEDGEPTGWIKEFAWFHFTEKLFNSIGWQPPMVMTPELMEPFFEHTKSMGITAIGDGILEGEEQLKAMAELDRQGKLNVYYDGIMRFWSYKDLPEKICLVKQYQKKYGSKHIKINMVKLFLDGTNESGNSALLSPLANDSSGTNFGEIKMDTEELTRCLVMCNLEGIDLQIHMVGDRAFRVGCDAVEAAQQLAKTHDIPWKIEPIFAHCELIDDADFQRPIKLGITINWTCHWAGGYFGTQAISILGEERWHRMYRIKELVESGALVAFSSDVTTFDELYRRANPFFGIQISHTRRDPEFPLDPDICPNSIRTPQGQELPLDFLIHGYTINGARQMRLDHLMGSLETGKLANFIVISRNPFNEPANQLSSIKPLAVIFDGKVISGQL